MIFKELINTVNYKHVWAVLNEEYVHKDGAYEAYKKVFEELKILEPGFCEPPITLIVAKIEDCIEPGTYIFNVFGIIKGDKNHYALEMTSQRVINSAYKRVIHKEERDIIVYEPKHSFKQVYDDYQDNLSSIAVSPDS